MRSTWRGRRGRRTPESSAGVRARVSAPCRAGWGLWAGGQKWGENAPFCAHFDFAVPPEFPREMIPPGPGLIVADGFGGAVLLEPPACALAPARRKALTLQFARLAAMRASGVVY